MTQPITYQNYINGAFESAREHLEVYNPASQALLSRVPASSAEEIERALSAARAAQKGWAARPAVERAAFLHRLADKLRDNVAHLARGITEEQGKVMGLPRPRSRSRSISPTIISTIWPSGANASRTRLSRVIARKMAPALVTGNTIVIKPSEETTNKCFEFARLIDTLALPPGVFNVVSGSGATTGNVLTASLNVDMISLTGSVATGSRIMPMRPTTSPSSTWNWAARHRPS